MRDCIFGHATKYLSSPISFAKNSYPFSGHFSDTTTAVPFVNTVPPPLYNNTITVDMITVNMTSLALLAALASRIMPMAMLLHL
jgi:hypothetical protein